MHSDLETRETSRLRALDSYGILDTPAEQGFDDIVLLASQICDTPVALVSLVAEQRQWFKARIGFDPCETSLSQSVCRLALNRPGLLIIPDLMKDERTSENILVTGAPHIRFYAGARLEAPSGDALGMLCVIDTSPRPNGLTEMQSIALEALARQVMSQLELRRGNVFREKQLEQLNEILREKVESRTTERDIAWKQSRDLQAVLDAQGTIESVNDAWTTILGWKPDEVVGRNHLFFVDPDYHQSSVEALARWFDEALLPYESRYLHKNGSYRWISWVASPGGDIVFASGRDVTIEKTAAAELAVTQEQLRQSQKMEAVGQLTGGLAHDFNNLLAVVSGSLELLERSILRGKVTDTDRFLNAAQTASKRAANLTHRLLAFSRRQTLDPRPTEINQLVAGMDDLIRRTVGPQVSIEVVGAAGLWTTLVDRSQLENALLNLCINARDAMPEGGRITIETANRWMDERAAKDRDLPTGQYVSLCVSDTGTGMSLETVRRAFEPFFTTKPLGQGTGLGLSMIYGFARQSGGQARIYSELGEGTTICIYIPRHYGESGMEDDAVPATPSRSGAGQTVLVVDDEPGVRMLVTEVLQDLGYEAIESHDGPTALKIIGSNVRIDLLVTDVGLPGGMNGRQLADASRLYNPDLKVLFITGYAENAVVGNGHLDHGMAVMTKPFAVDALANRIEQMLDL